MLPTLLSAARITGIMQGLQDIRLLPQQLLFAESRIPDVPALDEEIMARFVGQVLIADLIADDAKAVTYSQGRFQFETTKVPNLKLGLSVSQAMLNLLDRLSGQYQAPADMGLFTNWENRTVQSLLLGVRQRKEALHIAMLTDGLNYDRLGIKMSNVTWGMPSDLKVTASVTWDTAGSATPVADILGVQLTASVRYGQTYNRLTMSTQTFRYMIATTEFQNKARMYLAPNVSFVNLSTSDLTAMKSLAQNVLGMTIELYDARYWFQDENGAVYSNPFLPITKVILANSDDDGNPNAWDFANGIITEGILSNLNPVNVIGGRIPRGYGPIAYPTANPDLNPPNLVYWGVARGFPRKHRLQASAVITTGTYVDGISTTVPFPA